MQTVQRTNNRNRKITNQTPPIKLKYELKLFLINSRIPKIETINNIILYNCVLQPIMLRYPKF